MDLKTGAGYYSKDLRHFVIKTGRRYYTSAFTALRDSKSRIYIKPKFIAPSGKIF